MSGKRESVALVLDVGPRMHPHLAHAARAAGDFLTQKMLHKVKDEVCLVLFGADATRNRENDESAMEEGREDEYANIVEALDLGPPDGSYIQAVHTIQGGHGRSDFKEALTVATSVLVKEKRAFGSVKRIVLISNLCSRAQDDPDDDLTRCLAEGLQSQGIFLDVLLLDVPEDDEQYEQDKMYNLNQLAAICQELSHRERHFSTALLLAGAFRAHEVLARAYYSGPLSIGTKLHIKVKTAGKADKEKFPPPGKEVVHHEDDEEGRGDGGVAAAEGDEGAYGGGAYGGGGGVVKGEDDEAGGIYRSREYHFADQEAHGSEPVGEDKIGNAYLYGGQLVPVDPEEKAELAFPVERGMKLLGFLDEDEIPRHYYMAKCDVVVADKASPASCLALAALVEAMIRQKSKAVVRWVPKATSKPELFLGTPVAAGASSAPHLLLNALPFMEDMRDYRFPTFAKESWMPSDSQIDAAKELVQSMSLGQGDTEQLQPERTPDPALHRLYYECGRRVVDRNVELQAEDELANEVMQPHLERMPGAQEALEAALAAFPMDQQARAVRRAVSKIGLEDPAGDVRKLMADGGDPQDALVGLAGAISGLVFGSMGSSKFNNAVQLVDVLRENCVAANEPAVFNNFLEAVEKKCKMHDDKLDFWKWLVRREIKKIAKEEAGASKVEASEAETWYTQKAVT